MKNGHWLFIGLILIAIYLWYNGVRVPLSLTQANVIAGTPGQPVQNGTPWYLNSNQAPINKGNVMPEIAPSNSVGYNGYATSNATGLFGINSGSNV